MLQQYRKQASAEIYTDYKGLTSSAATLMCTCYGRLKHASATGSSAGRVPAMSEA